MALTFEQIAEAAQSLRDDPTFDTMGEAARHVEARFLVQPHGGDGDDVSAVVEWAKALDPTPPAIGNRVRAHIPGNANVEPPAPPPPAPKPQKPRVLEAPEGATAASPAPDKLPFLYRVKGATGATDRELSELLGVPRSTVQAIISGRSPERFSREQIAALSGFLRNVIATLNLLTDALSQRTTNSD